MCNPNCIRAFEHIKNTRFHSEDNSRRIYFTLHNEVTGNNRTFRIEKNPTNAKFAPDTLALGLLVGPENDGESSYKTFAFVNDTDVVTWKKYRESKYNVLAQLVAGTLLENPKYNVPPTLKLIHAGRCFRCGRPLTTPQSIETGLGPICAEKLEY